MGLDCYIWDNNKTEKNEKISKEIADKFKEIETYGIIGFNINKSANSDDYFISFREKGYNKSIKKITNIGLYSDLNYDNLNTMSKKIYNFIENYDEICYKNNIYIKASY